MATICEIKVELKSLGVKGTSGKNKAELLDMLAKAKQPKEAPKSRTIKRTKPVKQLSDKELEYNTRKEELEKKTPDPPEMPVKYSKNIKEILRGRPDTTHEYAVYGLAIPYNGKQKYNDLRSYMYSQISNRNNNSTEVGYLQKALKWLDSVARKLKTNDDYDQIILYSDWERLF